MPAPDPSAVRTPLHRRAIEIQGYRRSDGLYDIEASLIDTKPHDFPLAQGVRRAGEPIHAMRLRITVDRTLTIVDAEAAVDGMPYEGDCNRITSDYRKLVGVAIRPGYTHRLKELFGGVRGCTHLSDLAAMAATAAFQTLAGERLQDPARKPFQIDRCHALDGAGPVVARYYPRWYRGGEAIEPADGAIEQP